MQYPPQPPYGLQQPVSQPPRKKSRKKPILFGCLGLVVLLLVIIVISAIATGGGASQATSPTATPATQATTAPTHAPTTAPVSTSSKPTHGMPQLGGNISDFYGKYGTPSTQGVANSETWINGTNQAILNARPDSSGKVTYVSVSGPTSWNSSQTSAACTAFLPADASQFNAVGNLTDYHSSIGEIVLNNAGQGVCTIYTAGS